MKEFIQLEDIAENALNRKSFDLITIPDVPKKIQDAIREFNRLINDSKSYLTTEDDLNEIIKKIRKLEKELL